MLYLQDTYKESEVRLLKLIIAGASWRPSEAGFTGNIDYMTFSIHFNRVTNQNLTTSIIL